jgi:hypothetical protein
VGNTSASCNGAGSMKPKLNDSDGSSQTVLLMSLVIAAIVIVFTVLLSAIVTHYRRQITLLHL